jgi:hypothetical protein
MKTHEEAYWETKMARNKSDSRYLSQRARFRHIQVLLALNTQQLEVLPLLRDCSRKRFEQKSTSSALLYFQIN